MIKLEKIIAFSLAITLALPVYPTNKKLYKNLSAFLTARDAQQDLNANNNVSSCGNLTQISRNAQFNKQRLDIAKEFLLRYRTIVSTGRKNNSSLLAKLIKHNADSIYKITQQYQTNQRSPFIAIDSKDFYNKADVHTSNLQSAKDLYTQEQALFHQILCEYLKKNPNQINMQDQQGNTPCHLACQAGHLWSLIKLLELSADLSISNNEGSTPLISALYAGSILGSQYIIDHLKKEERELIINKENYLGDTPLVVAARHGFKGIISKLLMHKAKIDHQNSVGDTALIEAVRHGHYSAAKKLISSGAKVHLKNYNKESALDVAFFLGENKTISLLKNAELEQNA